MNPGVFRHTTHGRAVERQIPLPPRKAEVPLDAQLQEAESAVRAAVRRRGLRAAAAGRTRRPCWRWGALLNYLHETQKNRPAPRGRPGLYRQGQFMELDLTARRNLELTETLRSKEKRGASLWVLDKTKNPPWAGGCCAAGWSGPCCP